MNDLVVWPGWVAGALIGLYLAAQYLITGKPLGCSSGYGNACGLVSKRAFFHQGSFDASTSWRLWFALGLPLGGLLAALSSSGIPTPSLEMGTLYESVLPQAIWLRGLYLMLGGMLIGFGARLAGGCQSGHSINGLSQLNPVSLLASVGFFVGGIASVQALFGFFG